MAGEARSDVASDDGNWSDVYTDSKADPARAVNTKKGETPRDNMSGVQAEAGQAVKQSTSEQDNDLAMVDHRSESVGTVQGGHGSALEAVPGNEAAPREHELVPGHARDIEATSDATLETVTQLEQGAPEQNLNASAATQDRTLPFFDQATFVDSQQAETGEPEVEFSDAPSDTSSDTSDDSGLDDSEDDWQPLSLEAQSKILEQEMGEGDDKVKNEKVANKSYRPRTEHELQEEAPQRPDIVLTPTDTEALGTIQTIVENTILIVADTSGEYEVVMPGSVICTTDLQVIGVISDLFGKVTKPMYSVLLGDDYEQLISDLGLAIGSKVLYAKEHCEKVFTQPLKGEKGTDASNMYDEQVKDDELDFSDDEKEAEFKKMRKQAKEQGLEKLTRAGFEQQQRSKPADRQPAWATKQKHRGPSSAKTSHHPLPPRPQSDTVDAASASGRDPSDRMYTNLDMPDVPPHPTLDYDGDGNTDEPYRPLKRPENFIDMMKAAPPPWSDQRGGRGRGSRGRGQSNARGGANDGRNRGRPYNSPANTQQSLPQAPQYTQSASFQFGMPAASSAQYQYGQGAPHSHAPAHGMFAAPQMQTAYGTQAAPQTTPAYSVPAAPQMNSAYYPQAAMSGWPPAVSPHHAGQYVPPPPMQQPYGYQQTQPAMPAGVPPTPSAAQLAQWYAAYQQNSNQSNNGN